MIGMSWLYLCWKILSFLLIGWLLPANSTLDPFDLSCFGISCFSLLFMRIFVVIASGFCLVCLSTSAMISIFIYRSLLVMKMFDFRLIWSFLYNRLTIILLFLIFNHLLRRNPFLLSFVDFINVHLTKVHMYEHLFSFLLKSIINL